MKDYVVYCVKLEGEVVYIGSGIAGFNDKSRPANVDGKHSKEYKLWTMMLRRCFSEKHLKLHPTYKGCNVSNKFLDIS